MTSCRLCGQPGLSPMLELGAHPIAHRLLTDPKQEEYVHPVDVRFCEGCGLLQLVDPVPPAELYTEYNWLTSWKNAPHLPRLVELVEQLQGLDERSSIVEVGSNDGTFLALLRDRGYRDLLGIEPAKDARQNARQKGVRTLGSYFSLETASALLSQQGKCDLLVARHVLEHVDGLDEFGEAMQVVLSPGGYVLIEVPNFEWCLDAADYSAIWEEHVNYFTFDTLARLLAGWGISVSHSETHIYSGQALVVLGQFQGAPLPTPSARYLPGLRGRAVAYRDRWPRFRAALVRHLREYRAEAKTVAFYGAGCRATSLINFAGLGPYIEFAVDDQLEKQDKYMPGSRIPVLPSDALEEHAIDLCLLAVNGENEERVVAKHRDYQERGGVFASVLPPSDRLLGVWDGRDGL